MPSFQYKAVDRDGALVQGTLEGSDRNVVVTSLQARGYTLLRADLAEQGTIRGLLTRDLFGSGRLSSRAQAELIRRLSVLLASRVPAEEALRILADAEATPRMRRHVTELLRRLRGGARLADAMAGPSGRIYADRSRHGQSRRIQQHVGADTDATGGSS